MRIFISYSTFDLKLVSQLSTYLHQFGDVKYWADSKEIGKDAWQTIFSWIDSSDVVIVLITDNTLARGFAVGQEVGRANAKDKFIIPIISNTVLASDLGFMSGIAYQQIDLHNPIPAIFKITERIQKLSVDIKQRQNIAIALAILGIFILLFSDN